MRPTGLTYVVLFATLSAGCHERTNPAAPGPPATTSPTMASLVIAGANAMLTGTSSNYYATATLSDGTTRTVTPNWSSSNSDVANVDNAGRLEGRVHGTTTVTATHDGMSATKSVQVVNDYRGTWDGRFIVNGCDAPPGVCNSYEVDVFSFPIHLEILQTGNDLSEIRAKFLLASFQLRAELIGRVSADGRLNLAGSAEMQDRRGNAWATLHVGAWDTTLSGNGMMTGRWAQRLSRLQPLSNEIMENELETMTRTSDTITPVSASLGAPSRRSF